MPGNFKKEDLRIRKTRMALFSAMPALLNRQAFAKITVYDICEESLVSRTAFYAHFCDKYDLLEQWLLDLQKRFVAYARENTREQVDQCILKLLQKHTAVVSNLLEDSGRETLNLILRALTLMLDEETITEERALLTQFLAGGLFYVLMSYSNNSRHISEEQTKFIISHIHTLVMFNLNQTIDIQGTQGGISS